MRCTVTVGRVLKRPYSDAARWYRTRTSRHASPFLRCTGFMKLSRPFEKRDSRYSEAGDATACRTVHVVRHSASHGGSPYTLTAADWIPSPVSFTALRGGSRIHSLTSLFVRCLSLSQACAGASHIFVSSTLWRTKSTELDAASIRNDRPSFSVIYPNRTSLHSIPLSRSTALIKP